MNAKRGSEQYQPTNSVIATVFNGLGLMGVSGAEMLKLRVGCCLGCGYDLRGLPSPICPECGRVREAV